MVAQMKPAIHVLCIVFATVILLVFGATLGVSYERRYNRVLFREAAGMLLACAEELVECEEDRYGDGVRL